MNNPKKGELKELTKELERIDKGGKEDCVMCKFVLIFAVAVLLLVAAFAFFFRLGEDSQALVPLPPEEAPGVDPALWDERMRDVGSLVHPELASTTSPEQTVPPAQDLPPQTNNPLMHL